MRNSPIRVKRTGSIDSATALPSIAMLMLFDVRNLLSDAHVSEQDALARLTKLQKRFFSFEELGLAAEHCLNSTRDKSIDLPPAVAKQVKTTTKAHGIWFVTVDAALKLVFRHCTPQDAIRLSLELSPLLLGTRPTNVSFHSHNHSLQCISSPQSRWLILSVCQITRRSSWRRSFSLCDCDLLLLSKTTLLHIFFE